METTVIQPTDELQQRCKKMFQDGKLIHIYVGKWQMAVPLTATDLKLEAKDVSNLIKLGRKMLFDPQVLAKFTGIESKARTYLKNNSFRFPIAEAHFVPKKRLLKVVHKLTEFKVEYDKATAEFLNDYESLKAKVIEANPELKDILLPFYPPIEKVRTKFTFQFNMFEVSFPKKIDKIEYDQLVAEEEAKGELKSEMRQQYEAELAAQRQEAERRMNEFVTEAIKASRSQIVEVFEKIAIKIQNKELVTTRNINSIKSLVDTIRSLDFFNDSEVTKHLSEVEKLVSTTSNFKDNAPAIERLSLALGSVLGSVRNMSDVDTLTGEYFRKLEI